MCVNINKISFFLIFAAILSSCGRPGYASFSGYAQGGVYSVKYNREGVSLSRKAVADSVEAILAAIDASVSGYNKSSVLSRYNSGQEVEPDVYFSELLAFSEEFRNFTGGAFDAAAGPLFDVWGFGFTGDSLPSPERIAQAMELSAQGKYLNFNAIAQGYTCDVIAAFLDRAGARDLLVDVGEIFCRGVNASGRGWSIGIDDPYDGNDTPGASLRGIWVSDGMAHGVVTSGNYRKFYVRDGKKYAHTIDPRTGYPVQHNLLSATIIAPTATVADAVATYCMVIGQEEARSFIESDPEIEGCLISSDTTWYSSGFHIR